MTQGPEGQEPSVDEDEVLTTPATPGAQALPTEAEDAEQK